MCGEGGTKMIFYQWMLQFIGRNTPMGELAGDIKRNESTFPKEAGYNEIADYLRTSSRFVQPNASRTFESAWKRYKRENGDHV